MASIRKRGRKWQVQVRRKGYGARTRSFHVLKDAETWARQMEVQADRGDLPARPFALREVTLGQLIERYRDTVSQGNEAMRQSAWSSMPSYVIQSAAVWYRK
jgi:hypothetical protein